ncbi:MAG: preprotein translocase subunit YajC [Candidatus Caldatribacteriaceae bacterium]
MSFFLSVALAANQTPPSGSAPTPSTSPIASFLPLIFIILIFYFLLIVPQQRKQKSQRELWGGLKKGDKVVTVGGIHGTITQVEEDEVLLEVAKDVRIRISKTAVASKRS